MTRLRTPAPPRPVVAESWERSRSLLVDPEALPALEVPEDVVDDLRAVHPLAGVLPVVRDLLVADAVEAGLIVAVGDEFGRLLWVEGDRLAMRSAEAMQFVAGAGWAETRMGTSAPGTALALDKPVQIRGPEHFNRLVQGWSCTAVPLHDPTTNAVIGVLDLTGDERAVGERSLPLLRSVAAAMQAELALSRLQAPRRAGAGHLDPVTVPIGAGRPSRAFDDDDGNEPDQPANVRVDPPVRSTRGSRTVLRVLDRDEAELVHDAGPGRSTTLIRLSARHSEIMTVLAAHPSGVGAGELAEEVYGDAGAVVTLRAELVRLRHVLGALAVDIAPLSRPYRLPAPVTTDAAQVVALADRGARIAAIRGYVGPVLPASNAPGIESLREDVRARLGAAVVEDGSVRTLLAWIATADGATDAAALRLALTLLPPRSPRRAGIVAALERLEG